MVDLADADAQGFMGWFGFGMNAPLVVQQVSYIVWTESAACFPRIVWLPAVSVTRSCERPMVSLEQG
jgi:hypothetical protein